MVLIFLEDLLLTPDTAFVIVSLLKMEWTYMLISEIDAV